MRMRLHVGIIGIILITGLIIGSFCDLQISQAIFQNRNGFGITVSALGLLIGYGLIPFVGGLIIRTTIGSAKPKWAKILLYVLAAITIGVAAFFAQKEIFSINGFNKHGIGWTILAWAIALVVEGSIFYLTFKFTKNYHNDKFWIVALLIFAAVILSLLAGVTVLKDIVHRPRYRTVQLGIEGLYYHNWWEPFKEYKNYITDAITKEEFKSFPSGHAGASFLAITFAIFVPSIFKMKKSTQLIVFYGAVIYFLLICFSRVLVGAHFLSDVSMGGLLSLVFSFIAYEICLRNKLIEIQ